MGFSIQGKSAAGVTKIFAAGVKQASAAQKALGKIESSIRQTNQRLIDDWVGKDLIEKYREMWKIANNPSTPAVWKAAAEKDMMLVEQNARKQGFDPEMRFNWTAFRQMLREEMSGANGKTAAPSMGGSSGSGSTAGSVGRSTGRSRPTPAAAWSTSST